MDKDTILYATVDEQIEKLKKQGLIINSLDFARSELALYGYSNLIKSYRDPYMIMSEEGSKSYRSGITFELYNRCTSCQRFCDGVQHSAVDRGLRHGFRQPFFRGAALCCHISLD